jgi:hypothetical protein
MHAHAARVLCCMQFSAGHDGSSGKSSAGFTVQRELPGLILAKPWIANWLKRLLEQSSINRKKPSAVKLSVKPTLDEFKYVGNGNNQCWAIATFAFLSACAPLIQETARKEPKPGTLATLFDNSLLAFHNALYLQNDASVAEMQAARGKHVIVLTCVFGLHASRLALRDPVSYLLEAHCKCL